jgi:hypothetical protein
MILDLIPFLLPALKGETFTSEGLNFPKDRNLSLPGQGIFEIPSVQEEYSEKKT